VDYNKFMFNKPKVHRLLKRMLKDYQGALENLDKTDAPTLGSHVDVKRMLKEYQRALEDLNKADVIEPKNASTLRNHGNVKYMLHDHQRAL